MNYTTVWTFRTSNFRVMLEAAPEQDPDFSFDETGKTADKVARGVWDCVAFRVRITGPGGETLGADYLGNSIYADLMDFRREHIGARGKWGSYFRDMVAEAVAEARRHVRQLQEIPLRLTA